MKIKIVKSKNYKQLKPLYKEFTVSDKGDICIAAGGDGTFVRAAREYKGPILPIRGNEKGSMGYYSDLSLNDIGFVVKNLKEGNYNVERLGYKIEIVCRGKKYYAVNEALLHNIIGEVSFNIYEIRQGKRYKIYPYIMSGDGILITSSIGSTAYNKSAGGPILLVPDVFCLTFLNVDGPYKNSIVIDASKEIEIEVVKYGGVLRYDGNDIGRLKPGEKFRVRMSDKELSIVRFKSRREELAKKLDRIIRSRMTK